MYAKTQVDFIFGFHISAPDHACQSQNTVLCAQFTIACNGYISTEYRDTLTCWWTQIHLLNSLKSLIAHTVRICCYYMIFWEYYFCFHSNNNVDLQLRTSN